MDEIVAPKHANAVVPEPSRSKIRTHIPVRTSVVVQYENDPYWYWHVAEDDRRIAGGRMLTHEDATAQARATVEERESWDVI
jgi:hypothetical protein